MRPIACLVPALLLESPVLGATIRVPQEQPTIQAGIDAAAPGDTVLISPGTYFEHDVLLQSGVVLAGETGDPADVIVDAAGLGPALRCVGAASGTRMEGLTVRRGAAPPGTSSAGGGLHCAGSVLVVSRCRFLENTGEFGAGAGCLESDATFERCDFAGNTALAAYWAAGGALYCHASTVVLRECTVSSNSAFSTTLPGDGGGVFSHMSVLTAAHCTFVAGSSGAGGGALYSYDLDRPTLRHCTFTENVSRAGGAMYMEGSLAQIEDCTFARNEAWNGGAIFMARSSVPRILRSRFESNVARPNSGGAVDCWRSFPVYEDCVFAGNAADLNGGAMTSNNGSRTRLGRCVLVGNSAGRRGGALATYYAAETEVTSCTLARNAAPLGGGGIHHLLSGPLALDRTIVALSTSGGAVTCADGGEVTLVCCDVFGNAGGDWTGCIADQQHVAGNFSLDPLFCDVDAAVVTLSSPASPCLPPNNACEQLVGALGEGCGGATSAPPLLAAEPWSRIKAAFRR